MFEMTHENSKNVHLELFARHYFNEHFNQLKMYLQKIQSFLPSFANLAHPFKQQGSVNKCNRTGELN